MCKTTIPTKDNPSTLHSLKCFNCKTSPKYYYDDTWGVDCSPGCSKETPCEGCKLDGEHPHVVVHEATGCPFGYEMHDKTKNLAIKGWKEANNPQRGKK